MKIEIDVSDLLKIRDALEIANRFFQKRDEMNASIHLATEIRYSPITSIVLAAHDRCFRLLEKVVPL